MMIDTSAYPYLESVSCSSSSFCAAVDFRGNAMIFNGASWSAPVLMGNGETVAVSCSSASFCVAVNFGGGFSTYNGSSWSVESGMGFDQLLSLSCSPESLCMVTAIGGLASTFNGSSWSEPVRIEQSSGFLNSVSCPSSLFCAAVDDAGNVLTFDGSSWSAPTEIDRNVALHSVSCPSSFFCVAINGEGDALIGSESPSNLSPPTISGSAVQGHTLTETHGLWSNEPTSYTYQWEDCDSAGNNCSNIVGATGQTYTLTATDVGHTTRVQETASNAGGTRVTATAAATALVQGASSGGSGGGASGSPGSSAIVCVRTPCPGPGGQGGGTTPLASVSSVSVDGDLALISLSCRGSAGSSCTVTFTLTVVEKLRQGKLAAVSATAGTRHRASKVKFILRIVIVGRKTITLTGGESEVVRLPLNATGRRLLDARRVLAVKLTVSENGVRLSSQIVRFKAPDRKARRRR